MTTTDTSPIAVVEAFLLALERADEQAALALLADDVIYQNVPLPADRGKQAVARTLSGFRRVVDTFKVEMRNIAQNGNVVLTERVDILSGRFVHLDIWVCGTFEVRDGKITLWRDYFDYAQVTARLLTFPFRKLLGTIP